MNFIHKTKRVSNLKSTIVEPWGASDATRLFAKICELENQDVASLLPQGAAKVGGISDDPVGSLFDLKTGLWKETVIVEEGLKRPETVELGNLSSEAENTVYSINEENQYVGELSVSSVYLWF